MGATKQDRMEKDSEMIRMNQKQIDEQIQNRNAMDGKP